MSYIIDRLILIFLSVIIMFRKCNISEIIVIGLIAIIIAALSYYFDAMKITEVIGIVYMIACVVTPQFIFIAPVVMYELYGKKRYIEMAVFGIINIISFHYLDKLSPDVILLILLFQLISCILYKRSSENERLLEMVKHIRDDSEERNILLTEKNKHLIEKQDSEVYVATLKERNRIAREIHDNVGHMITRSILQMGALMTINKEEPLHGQLESVKNNLDVAMNNIRESVHDLHDESVDMKQTIKDLIKELDGKYNCKFEYDAGKSIDRKYKYAIIGIVKEAVSNILKYSANDRVDVIVREHPGMYQLIVHDYSTGNKTKTKLNPNETEIFESSRKSGEGIGLQNMQDRVASLKGNITIDQSNGFKIFVTLPR